jgi:hypothetical protein
MNFVENKKMIDFDTNYLPVFLYSHAEFAEYNEACKVANPKVSDEVSGKGLVRSFEKLDDFFTNVPDDMIVVDPVPSGLLCMSGWEVDEMFPWFISSSGSNAFLNKDKLSIQYLKNKGIKSTEIDILQHLYNNRKVYYSGNEINNYRIAFDTNTGNIPWGIRIPIYKNKEGEYTDDNLELNTDDSVKIEMVHTEWSRQYSTARNNQCIYLDEVLNKIREFVNEIYTNKPKIILYLVSCRKQPDYEYIYENDPEFKQNLLNRQLSIDTLGRKNVPAGSVTDRKLRDQQTFTYEGDTDDIEKQKKYQKRLLDIQINSRPLKKSRRSIKRETAVVGGRKNNKKTKKVKYGKSVKRKKGKSRRRKGKSIRKGKK